MQAATDAPTPEPQTRIAALRLAAEDRLAQLLGLVRVVDPVGVGVRAQVDDLVPQAVELLEQTFAQLHAAVVESDSDTHRL